MGLSVMNRKHDLTRTPSMSGSRVVRGPDQKIVLVPPRDCRTISLPLASPLNCGARGFCHGTGPAPTRGNTMPRLIPVNVAGSIENPAEASGRDHG